LIAAVDPIRIRVESVENFMLEREVVVDESK
jgi:hypothetical protein